MEVGFTGSRDGINAKQQNEMTEFLTKFKDHIKCVHHGDCVGADVAFHNIAKDLGISISIHPPKDSKLRAYCEPYGSGKMFAEKDFLQRNHKIVDECGILIACPKTNTEQKRSGTWATIRYARKKKKQLKIFAGE